MGHCPYCGWADAKPFHTLSRHCTHQGLTVWTRCVCGSVQVRQIDECGARIVVRGRPTEGPERR